MSHKLHSFDGLYPDRHHNQSSELKYPLPLQRPWRDALRIVTRRFFVLLSTFWIGILTLALFVFGTIYPKFRLVFAQEITSASLGLALIILICLFIIAINLVRGYFFSKHGQYVAASLLIVATTLLITFTTSQNQAIRAASDRLWERLDSVSTPDVNMVVPPPPEIAEADTSTPTATATSSPTATASDTPMPSSTSTDIPTETETPVPTSTNTVQATETNTVEPTATDTSTATPPPTMTDTPPPTETPLPTATFTVESSATPSGTSTETPTVVLTDTPQPPSPTPTSVATETNTLLPPTATSTIAPSPSSTATATATESPTFAPSPTATVTPNLPASATAQFAIIVTEAALTQTALAAAVPPTSAPLIPTVQPSSTPIPPPLPAANGNLPNVLPTPTPTDTPTMTLVATATATDSPTATPTEIFTGPTLITDTIPPANTISGTAPLTQTQPASTGLTGAIAYTLFGSSPGVYVYKVAANSHTLLIPGARQPNMNSFGSVVAHSPNGSIVRISPDGSNLLAISTRPEDAHPNWSADANAVVFDSTDNANSGTVLRLQNNAKITQDGKLLVGPNGNPLKGQFPIFLANGRIAFKGCDSWAQSSNCGIYSINANGTNAIFISTDGTDIPTDNFGSDVLFMSRRNNNWDIFRTNANDRNNPIPIIIAPSNDGLATLSPDGQSIAFLTDRDGTWSVYVTRVDGTSPQKLFDLPGNAFASNDWTQDRLSWGGSN